MVTGPYKDKMGRYRTQSLFHEFSYMRKPNDDFNPLYTLKNIQTSDLPCLKDIYMDSNDPTEYNFAITAFNSWDQWKKIKNNNFITSITNSQIGSVGVMYINMSHIINHYIFH